MNITLRYFARLRETLGCDSEQPDLPPAVHTIGELVEWLRARGAPWSDALGADRPFRVAVNQELAQIGTRLSANDEVAIFPPVTGG